MNTVQQLHQAGQSIWYDNIQCGLLVSGALLVDHRPRAYFVALPPIRPDPT